jgi:flagellar biosynthetic protein FliR
MAALGWHFDGSLLVTLLLATVRAGAFLTVAPPFNTPMVPSQIKAILAVSIGLAVTPQLQAGAPPLDSSVVIVAAAEQVVVGAALGFVTSLLFTAFQSAGDLLDLFGGFQMASAYDPLAVAQTAVFGKFYNLLATTLLFGSEAHQLVIRGFTTSYQAVPITGIISFADLDQVLTSGITTLIVSALQIAGPLIAVLFCADVALGLLTRVAPALNAFSLGFPAKILVTVLLTGLAITLVPPILQDVVGQIVESLMTVIGR